jgi:amidohydrolase
MLAEKIKELAAQIHHKVVEDRRYLHAHPELSFLEFNTSAFVKQTLSEIGIPWQTMGETGIVGIITGEIASDEVTALRADMDALPIAEANDITYRSEHTGVMHACGHDAHTASLLGTARILFALKSHFKGSVKLIFQPAEEKIPGGALSMIADGALANPVPQAVIGQHVSPAIDSGFVGIKKGSFMASMDEIYMTVTGRGGHGAQPQWNIDPVLITCHIIIALQQIVSRVANPAVPTVLSFGKLVADGAVNIIPDKVYVEGTFRTLDEQWRSEAHTRMQEIANGIAKSMGGSCEMIINKGYPCLVNADTLYENVRSFSAEYLGESKVLNVDTWMAAEDFAYYAQAASGCFYLLGIRNEKKGIVSSLHTPGFNIDEDALLTSTGLMAYIATRLLGNS